MRNSIHETITINLVKIRNWKRYSQEEVARILDIRQSSYHRMEAGNTRISSDQLGVLAKFYKIDVNIFYMQEVVLSDETSSIIVEHERLKQVLAHQEIHADILSKRIEELEGKLERRNLKIDLLQVEIKKYRMND